MTAARSPGPLPPLLARLPRRRPSPASTISLEFDLARAGAMGGPDDAVAVHDGRVYVVGDAHGGRRVHERLAGEEGEDVLVPGGPAWVHRLEMRGGEVVAWAGSPTTEQLTAVSLRAGEWRPRPDLTERGGGGLMTVRHPTEPLSVQARRIGPGRSACRVVHDDGTVLARWASRLCGAPAWEGDRLWSLEEAWPRQRLVTRAGPGFAPTGSLDLPEGALAGLRSDGRTAAAIWTDPDVPACLVTAPAMTALAQALGGSGPPGDDTRPYTWRTGPVGGVPSVTYTPHDGAGGTVVMLHGGPHAATWPLFSPLIAFLAEQGWRVVTPNVSSSALASLGLPSGALGIDDAVDVVDVANAARGERDGPVVVVGWSYGAYVGARAVVLGLRCAGLVALSGVLDPTAVEARHPALARFLAAHALPPTPPDALGGVPVLAVHGRHDGRVDVAAHRRYVESLPAGTYLELPDEGHLIITDGGAALAYPALADWLARR